MRISRHKRHRRPKVEQVRYQANQRIRVPEVRIIDEKGEQLGVMTTQKAQAMAAERELDLVEVNPKADPPVCRFLDFGQFKYEKEKEARKQKAHAHKVSIKEIRLSARIGEHDRTVRRDKALSFLKEGNKVQLVLILRGRERHHADLAKEQVEAFAAGLNTEEMPTKVEQPFSRQGSRLTMVVARV
jgi:translation initiation factor IF-3